MKKKKWYWLRGGLLGFLLILLSIIFSLSNIGGCSGGFVCAVDRIVNNWIVDFPAYYEPLYSLLSNSGLIIMTLVFWPIVGAFMGYIYGKIKNRKKVI